MAFRIDRNPFFPVGERITHPAAGSVRRTGGSGQNFDLVQFSSRMTGLEGRVQDLSAQISQQARVRPTHQELQELRRQVEEGTYLPDSSEIAARMLLLEEGV